MKKAKPKTKQSRRAPKGRAAPRPASRAAKQPKRAQGKQAAKKRKGAEPKRAQPKQAAKQRGASKRGASKRGASKRAQPRRAAKPRAAAGARTPAARWPRFVEAHGVVLASARGPVPSVAEAIAGEPIVGSWWSHPKADAIFDALSVIDDSDDIRCFKLVDHKITFVHRRLWPALACLARAGVLEPERVASIQQEHMPTGEHRTFTTPFPDWVPDDVERAAAALTIDEARAQLGAWL